MAAYLNGIPPVPAAGVLDATAGTTAADGASQ